MAEQKQLAKAMALAAYAHADQFRWGGEPYVTHCIRVATAAAEVYDEDHAVVGALHDVLEDVERAELDVMDDGRGILSVDEMSLLLTDEQVHALRMLTHEEDESYEDYVRDIAEDQESMAVRIKVLDLTDNLRTMKVGSRSYGRHLAAYSKLCGVLR